MKSTLVSLFAVLSLTLVAGSAESSMIPGHGGSVKGHVCGVSAKPMPHRAAPESETAHAGHGRHKASAEEADIKTLIKHAANSGHTGHCLIYKGMKICPMAATGEHSKGCCLKKCDNGANTEKKGAAANNFTHFLAVSQDIPFFNHSATGPFLSYERPRARMDRPEPRPPRTL